MSEVARVCAKNLNFHSRNNYERNRYETDPSVPRDPTSKRAGFELDTQAKYQKSSQRRTGVDAVIWSSYIPAKEKTLAEEWTYQKLRRWGRALVFVRD